MELIVTEKENVARRIADILSAGAATSDRRGGVNVYRWGDTRCIGLSGHVVAVDFPPEYEDWRDVQPAELVEADVVKEVTRGNIVDTLQDLAGTADEVTIATDYDREGELIGKEAYELVREVTDAPIRRVRFSSITEREVEEAFADPDELDFDLAAAGEARQVIDLLWGAALTRFLSLSAGQLGEDFISVGRVQSPTLKLIVDREREIRAFDPEDYWELFAELATDGETFEAQYFYEGEDGTEQERVWDETEAESVDATLREASAATVTSVRRRTRTDTPPPPFNTTQFIRAAGSLGYSAQSAMSVAEDLYTAGYITYPRTDNTVYPDDLDERDLLERFASHSRFGEDAGRVLDQDDIEPTRGDSETTDHPPIHPTDEFPARRDLSDAEWEIYELVVRRFFATCARPAEWAHLRVVAEVDGHRLKANGKRLLEPGYHAVYPYFSTSENVVPEVKEGEGLSIRDARLEAKQTQPPRRRGQSRLIETMEEMGIGTKCLTADSRVLHRVDGDIERTRVDELFDDGQVVLADGDTDIAVSDDTRVVKSYDEPTGRVVEREATLVSERPLADDERVFAVRTEAGSFSVTDEHPLYVGTNGGVEVRPAHDIRPGDELLTARPGGAPPTPDESDDAVIATAFTDNCTDNCNLGVPSTTTVTDVRERTYEGPVYDLTVDGTAPNFAVEGGVIVHNSTRHHTVEKLYDRGYIEGDPPRPTNLAMAVVDAAEEFADRIVDEGMTQQLEADMAAIASGEQDLDEVTEESREMLSAIFEELHESREEIAEHLRESMKADRTLGPCPECGEDLLVRKSRQGSYFVGCDGFPDCRFTLPLPDNGEPTVIEETCEDHDLHHVRLLAGSDTFTYGCPRCQEERAEESEDRVIGDCPECGADHGGELAIKRTRTGGRLVGCTRYPDCEYSLPLPRRGDIEVTEEYCDDHPLPELVVHGSGDEPWELGCPICNYAEYQERQRANDLQDLDGVGERTVEKLADAGVENLADLQAADPDDLAGRVRGVSADAVREWQRAAGVAEA